MLNHHKNPHHTFMAIWVVGALIVLGVGMVGYALSHTPKEVPPRVTEVQEREPVASPATTLVLGINEAQEIQGVTVTIQKVLEDSRCPAQVQCVQAGTVRVEALVTTDSGTGTLLLVLGEPSTTETKLITLMGVSPENPVEGEYRFAIQIENR
jgi:hypothetical protein